MIEPDYLTDEQRAELASWRRVQRWTPLQLRHAAATTIRARFDIEHAEACLGHAKPDVTVRYAERDMERARRVRAAIG